MRQFTTNILAVVFFLAVGLQALPVKGQADCQRIEQLLHLAQSDEINNQPDSCKALIKQVHKLAAEVENETRRKRYHARGNLILARLMAIQTREVDKADSVAFKAYRSFKELEDWEKAGWSCIYKACGYYYGGKYGQGTKCWIDSTKHWIDKAIELGHKSNSNKLILMSYHNLAYIMQDRGDMKKALSNAWEVLRYAEIQDDSAYYAQAYNLLGNLYYFMEDLASSETYMRKAYQYAQEENLRLISKIDNWLEYGQILQIRNKNKASVDVFKNVLKLTSQKENYKKCHALMAYTGIGNALMKMEGWDKAEGFFTKSREISDRTGSKPAFHLVSLARVYALMGRTGKSLSLVEEFLHYYEDHTFKIDYYKDISFVYEKAGQTKKALKYYKKWSTLSDSIRSNDNKLLLANMKRKYKLEKKDRKITEQELALSQSKLELTQSHNQKLWLGGLLLLALLGGAGTVYYVRHKAQREKQAYQLRMKKEQLQQVLAAQEKERRHIARELHDGIGQSLSALKIQLQTIQSHLFPRGTLKRVDTLCREVRSLSHQMMPLILEEKGLKQALSTLVDQCFEPSPTNAHFVSTGYSKLTTTQETHLYRVGQELIYNIIKHANASEVGMQLLQSEERVIMIVEDNGQGFSYQDQKDGIGMKNVHSRLEALDGQIEVESSGNGTFIRITVPLAEENKISA